MGGVVDQILVKEGEPVKKGQVLLKLDTEATKDRQQSLQSSISFKQQQLLLKVEELKRYLDVNDTEQRMLVRSLGLAGDFDWQRVFKQAVATQRQFEFDCRAIGLRAVAGWLPR